MSFLARALRVAVVCLAVLPCLAAAEPVTAPKIEFPFQEGDHLVIMGSSSTGIGIWPKTIQFLLTTRHPELKVRSTRHTAGTFGQALEKIDQWLIDSKPTIVLFNFGGNDANAGEKGLPGFKANIDKIAAKVKEAGARPILMTHQSGDVRKAGKDPLARRKLYAEEMIAHAKEKNWPVIDTHHPLEDLQTAGQKDDEAYTILSDSIHLTEPAYIAWGYYLYERCNPPARESAATLTAKGEVTASTRCKIGDVKVEPDGLTFTRADEVLPILPPIALPPRRHVPLEKFSQYLLKVTGLPEGAYEIRVEGKPVGAVDAKALAEGVNLNSVLLDSKNPAPWEALAKDLWAGKAVDQVGKTSWKFQVQRQPK
jgi:lysophospholipase L1-like esterase